MYDAGRGSVVGSRTSGGAGSRDTERTAKGRCVVGRLSEFPRSIGVFNIGGQFYALRNRCPHQGAPLCRGKVKGTTIPGKPYEYVYGRDQEIIQCPWHGWEFEITTGRTFFNPHRMRVKTYEVTVEPGGKGDVTLETFEVTTEGEFVILHA